MRLSKALVLTYVAAPMFAVTAFAQPLRAPVGRVRQLRDTKPSLQWEDVVSVAGTFEESRDIAVDAQGNVTVMGYLPTEQDIDVLRFDPAGKLLWSRIIGGSGLDDASGLTVDHAGDIYIVGRSLSSDFPTLNAYQSYKNGPSDAILMKLSGADGSTIFSTYFGGSRGEWGFDVALGADGSIYIAGQTDSIDLETANPIQGSLTLTQCFCEDAFVTRFSPNADQVLFSTYLGGAFDDQASEIELDAAGDIYIAGRTSSDDFPTLNAIQPTYGGGNYDCWVASITAGEQLAYSTFLGGEDWDILWGMDADDQGNVTLAGSTRSVGFPTTLGAFQEQFAGGIGACEVPFSANHNCEDMFVTKLAPDGGYDYSTYIGGSQVDEARSVAVDGLGRANVIGYTYSSDFPPTTPDASIVTLRLSADGSGLDYVLTHYAANSNGGAGIAVHDGDVYIATKSSTANGNQVTYDTYVAKYGGAQTLLRQLP